MLRVNESNGNNNQMIAIKEIRVRPQQMDDKEYQFKFGSIIRFLEHGDQVKLIVMLRGQEITHKEIGERLLLRFFQDLEEHGKAEWPPVVQERQVFLVFAPKVK